MISERGNFELLGRAVTHIARPRFRVVFQPRADGGWDGGDLQWLDGPPEVPADAKQARAMAAYMARLVREAGDFFGAHCRDDWVQDRVIERARTLGLTAYAIARATGGAVSADHVQAYLCRRKSMGSHKLQHVLSVLGLALVETGTGNRQ